ncbi:MAG: hypothetical protein R3D33_00465 [Hyphomicrobiaceae bacterium]
MYSTLSCTTPDSIDAAGEHDAGGHRVADAELRRDQHHGDQHDVQQIGAAEARANLRSELSIESSATMTCRADRGT